MQRAVELADREAESGCTVALRDCDADVPECPMKELRASDIGSLLTVRGTVTRTTGLRALAVAMTFSCTKCGESEHKESPDGKLVPPTVCPGQGCRSRSFSQRHESAKHAPIQRVRLQEVREESSSGSVAQLDPGDPGARGLPATVECELREDLAGSCCPGELVRVRGFLRAVGADLAASGPAARGRKVDQRAFEMYIRAESVKNLSRSPLEAHPRCSAPPGSRSFSPHDRALMHGFAEEHKGRVFQQLLHSLCPSIPGHEPLKAGLVLSLFGGVLKAGAWEHSATPAARSNIHVLILGDPGVGKSQLLRAAAAVSPGSTYVCGTGASSAGLTLSVIKDADLTGESVQEAGALVLSDMGVCCVDEFEKMGSEYPALQEAMEHQRVSAAKAGLIASLPARAAIIAAANPVGGSYESVVENLRVSQVLISNFDLVFVARDQHPSGATDAGSSRGVRFSRGPNKKLCRREYGSSQMEDEDIGTFQQRLSLRPHEGRSFEPVPVHFFQKYIAYARAHVFPQVTPGASEVLAAFYEEAREMAEVMEGAPVTVRLLECLLRLAEARARLELREAITAEDAGDAVNMLRECGVGSSHDAAFEGVPHGARRAGGASKSSQKKEKQRFLRVIQKMSKQEPDRLFDRQEFSGIADDMGLCVPDLDALIYELNEAGLILYRAGKYRVNQE